MFSSVNQSQISDMWHVVSNELPSPYNLSFSVKALEAVPEIEGTEERHCAVPCSSSGADAVGSQTNGLDEVES
jgi:hypothetical protein